MSNAERVEAIFQKNYKAEAENKAHSIHTHIQSFLTEVPDMDMFEAAVDHFAIKNLTNAYFIDVIRYKEYHFTPKIKKGDSLLDPLSEAWTSKLHDQTDGPKINAQKIAALTVKWLLKYRPINLRTETRENDIPEKILRKAEFINERFSLAHTAGLLSLNLSESDLTDLLYHFRYRNYDERHFFIIFDLLKRYGSPAK